MQDRIAIIESILREILKRLDVLEKLEKLENKENKKYGK